MVVRRRFIAAGLLRCFADAGRCGEIIGGPEVEQPALPVDNRRRAPHAVAAVEAGQVNVAAVVVGRHHVGLPQYSSGEDIERDDRAAERAALVTRRPRHSFFLRSDADIRDAVVDDGRARDDRGEMLVNASQPEQLSRLAIDREHMRTGGDVVPDPTVAQDDRLTGNRRARSRDVARRCPCSWRSIATSGPFRCRQIRPRAVHPCPGHTGSLGTRWASPSRCPLS